MAITQTRVMALAQAAQAYQTGLERVISFMRGELADVHTGKKSWAEVSQSLAVMLHVDLWVQDAHIARSVIMEEVKHFEREAKSNDRARQRQRQYRVRQGKPRLAGHSLQQAKLAEDFRAAIPEHPTTAPERLGPQRRPDYVGADMIEEALEQRQEEDDPNVQELPAGVDLTRDPLAGLPQAERDAFQKEVDLALAQTEELAKQGLLGAQALEASPGPSEGDPTVREEICAERL